MEQVVEIPHEATIYLQKQCLTPGECLLHSRKVIFNLEKLGKSLTSALATSLKAQQLYLLRNKAFIAAVYVLWVMVFIDD